MASSLLWDVDVDSVYQIIDKHQESIASLDVAIEGFMCTIRQLQYQKQTHVAEIRRCKGIITLAKRLPPEILAYIFEECVQDGWTRTPLVVSHVCSSWRKAASIPAVWSHVYVNFDTRDPCKRTQFWFDKAGDSLLTINLEVGNDMSHLNRMTELLVSTLPRWKALTVKSLMLQPVNQILQACNRPTPVLRVVDVSIEQEFTVAPDSDVNELVGLHTSFPEAPLFKSLCIRRNILPRGNIIPSFIKNLSLHLPSHQSHTTQSLLSIIQVLEGLPNLESFSLEIPNKHTQQFELNVAPDRAVNLPHLSSITLMGKDNIFAILPHLRVPSPTHLYLRSSLDYFQPLDVAVWIELFFQHAQITLLEIRDLGLDSIAYDRILRSLPSVEELRLHDCDVVDSTLRALNGPHGLCRHLRKLDLRWCGRISGRALVDLVRSRLAGDVNEPPYPLAPAAIVEITLINCSYVREKDIMDLAQMTVCRLIHNGHKDLCSKPYYILHVLLWQG
ncbi:hypothetical protein HYPSUDRAFT_32008 [Hypholoma sublateritium FD-334 SS-4]|uniref:F-box domain-containing protein n=1 Tax=Hypholoma sublateritium (strain FD-334 SS-4) TaxID=945553 RepID=A0A0D2PP25_HYPSF|nr:hypothetical protein HYPSUDRAFT_32008 [Hypholoma sublateritium FD-334 SS-4]